MPVLGSPSWIPEPDSWQPISTLEIQNIIIGLAIAAEPDARYTADTELLVAAEAIVLGSRGQDVFVSESGGARWFAAGPRFVPETDLYFNLDELLEIASDDALIDCPVEFDPLDAELQAAARNALIAEDLLRVTEGGDRLDSFADARHFSDVFISVVQDWECGLVDRPVSSDVRLEVTEGLIPSQTAAICQQVTTFNQEDFTPDDLTELISTLTPATANDFARGFRLMEFSREPPLETLLQRLEALASNYNLC